MVAPPALQQVHEEQRGSLARQSQARLRSRRGRRRESDRHGFSRRPVERRPRPASLASFTALTRMIGEDAGRSGTSPAQRTSFPVLHRGRRAHASARETPSTRRTGGRNTIATVRWKYRRGYTGRNYHVTGGHENQARAAQRAKKPTATGVWVLRLLGLRGAAEPTVPIRRASPRHQRRHKS